MSAGMLSVVVVAYNSGEILLDCVQRVLAQPGEIEVIVIDNGGDDEACAALSGEARVTVLRQPGNPGFSVACNRGAASARGEFLLFLNPDCLLPSNATATLLAYLQADPDLAVLGAQLLDADGSPQAAARRETPTPARVLAGLLKPRAAPQRPLEGEGLIGVEAISGALMAMTRAWFLRLGGFDEGYRLHCEDLDLCRRALQAGGRVALAADLRPVHVKGTSSRSRPVWVEWQKHRGMLRYFFKFDFTQSPWWMRVVIPLGVMARFPLAALRARASARR